MKKINLLLLVLILMMSLLTVTAQNTSSSLNLQTLNNAPANFQNHISVVAFSTVSLPLNRSLMPQLDRLATHYANQQVQVCWVTSEAASTQLTELANQYPHITFLRDGSGSALKQMHADALPFIAVFDQQGHLVGQPLAGFDPQANLTASLSPTINPLIKK